jgi:uncharacterized protein (TIGR02246 family)
MPQLSADDRAEILELNARYSWAHDTDDAEAFAATFTPDGVFQSPGHDARGHAELLALGESIAPRWPRGIQHWVTNMVLDGDGERAQAKLYFTLHSLDENGDTKVGPIGYYEDDLVKVGGSWRYARRRYRPWPPKSD